MGVQSPLGASVEEFTRRMFAGESGVKDLRGTALPADFPVTIAGVLDKVVFS